MSQNKSKTSSFIPKHNAKILKKKVVTRENQLNPQRRPKTRYPMARYLSSGDVFPHPVYGVMDFVGAAFAIVGRHGIPLGPGLRPPLAPAPAASSPASAPPALTRPARPARSVPTASCSPRSSMLCPSREVGEAPAVPPLPSPVLAQPVCVGETSPTLRVTCATVPHASWGCRKSIGPLF